MTVNSRHLDHRDRPAEAAGTVDITVTTPGGTSATGAADKYTYDAAPTVTAVSPTAGPTAGGTTVTITGTDFTAGADRRVRRNRRRPASPSTPTTSITATAPAGSAGTVDVTVTTPGGTSATGTADKYTYDAGPDRHRRQPERRHQAPVAPRSRSPAPASSPAHHRQLRRKRRRPPSPSSPPTRSRPPARLAAARLT